MKNITLKAYGKINLGLDVTGVRDDGYHLVRMIMQTVGIYDRIFLKLKEDPERPEEKAGGGSEECLITLTCDRADVPTGRANIAWKAAAAVMDRCGTDEHIHIHIEKNIPMAAGMAGGSTDAAAVILGMNELFGLGMSLEDMDSIAVKLGADVPFCLRRGTYLAEGIGEVLTKLNDAPEAHVLIVNPPYQVSTAQVYRALDSIEKQIHPDIDRLCAVIDGQEPVGAGRIGQILHGTETADSAAGRDVRDLASCMGNILEQVTEPAYPAISSIKQEMVRLGACAAMMTGSGPTVFGLFDDEEQARAAYDFFAAHPETGSSFLTRFIR